MLLAPKLASGTWLNGRLLPMPTMPGQKPEAVEVKDGDWIAFADPTKVRARTFRKPYSTCPAEARHSAVLATSLANQSETDVPSPRRPYLERSSSRSTPTLGQERGDSAQAEASVQLQAVAAINP